MNNYNPMFNTMNMTRSMSPFATAGSSINIPASTIARGGLFSKIGGSKITLSGILNGAQKTIGTVNQVVPLYNQVKPLFQNSKVLLNVAKAVKGNNQSRGLFAPKRRRQTIYEPIQKEEVKKEEPITINEEEKQENTNYPSKPFFPN